MRTLDGHFDGQVVVLDEPAQLKPNTKVKVVIAEEQETDAELTRACAQLSERAFEKVWDNSLDAEYDNI